MKFRFDPSLIAVATATYYPKWYRGKLKSLKHTDKIRGDLALELVQTAKNSGFKVVIADDKSSKSFRRALYKIDGIKIIKRRSIGYSQGRRKAIEAAVKLGIKVIVLTEPEKLSLIGSIPQIARPILDGQADIVVPKREQKLFEKSYTDYQYESETEGNSLYNENLRVRNLLSAKDQDLDLLFGPRVIKNDKKIISLFMKKFKIKVDNFSMPKDYFNPEEYSNVLFFPIVSALKKGVSVKSVEVPFYYPATQKENEVKLKDIFIEKRRIQKLGLLIELMHFLK